MRGNNKENEGHLKKGLSGNGSHKRGRSDLK